LPLEHFNVCVTQEIHWLEPVKSIVSYPHYLLFVHDMHRLEQTSFVISVQPFLQLDSWSGF